MKFFLFALLLVSLPLVASAQEQHSSRLLELNREIEVTEGAVAEIAAREAGLAKDISALGRRIGDIEAQEAKAAEELERASAHAEVLAAEIHQTTARAAALERASRVRTRALYMYGRRTPLLLYAKVESESSFLRHTFYFSKVKAFDAGLLRELVAVRERAASAKSEAQAVIERQQILRSELAAQRSELGRRRQEQQTLRQKLRTDQSARERLLVTLRAQALRLEAVLASLTNGGEEPVPKSKRSRRSSPSAFAAYDGAGLAALRGRLSLPSEGTIVGVFGEKHAQSGVPRKGVDIAAEPGDWVRAVASGRVLFVGPMPELGTVLVLDHGQRFYSLYGRLQDVRAKKGQELDSGDRIAKTSDPDGEKANLYFEIRSAGAALDPAGFFKKK